MIYKLWWDATKTPLEDKTACYIETDIKENIFGLVLEEFKEGVPEKYNTVKDFIEYASARELTQVRLIEVDAEFKF